MPEAEEKTGSQRIRGPNLETFVKKQGISIPGYQSGAPFEKAIARADAEGRVVISNKRMTEALRYIEKDVAWLSSVEWDTKYAYIPCWTGTMAAYEAPGKALGETIEKADPKSGINWIFPVPEEYRGEKDIVLVSEHPDYSIERKGNDRIVRTTAVDAVKNFPEHSGGMFKADPKHHIPIHEKLEIGSPDAFGLSRIPGKRVGPVARCHDVGYGASCFRWKIVLNLWPSERLGMAVEAP